MKRAAVFVSLVLFVLAPGVLFAGDSAEREGRFGSVENAESVHIVDRKGVETDATGFGKIFALQVLNGFRGDSEVQIPFERIKSLTTEKIVDGKLPVDVVLTSGTAVKIVLDRVEYQAMYGGNSEFGYFRIRLQDIQQLTFHRPKRRGEGLGQRCPKGHIWYNETWKYCPYDGLKLTPIRSE